PLVIAQATCVGDEQRIALRQERFIITSPAAAKQQGDTSARQRWQVPVAVGRPGALRPAQTILLQDRGEITGARCGEPVKLNLGDIGDYRVEYDAASRAALAKTLPLMAPADRVNLLADSWALVEAGRTEPSSYLELVEEIGNDSTRAVWEQVIGTLT